MSKSKAGSRLAHWVTRYLTHKRALGHRFRGESWLLKALHRNADQRHHHDLDAACFETWLKGIKHLHPNTRRKYYQTVRLFCLYRQRNEPGCFVPSSEGAAKLQPYVTPVIVEPDQIVRMLDLASGLQTTSRSPLRGQAMRLAIVLLYTCGLRLGELVRLTMADIEEHGTVLRIRESKFHKSRLVPLSLSGTRELEGYLRKRRKALAVNPKTPLLCNRYGGRLRPYSHPGLQFAINQLFEDAGVHDEGGRRPRIHDLRHSFAVQALVRWYREGADVQTSLPKLALYMGHVSLESSAYYLHWIPSLRNLASQRFEQKFGQLLAGGCQ